VTRGFQWDEDEEQITLARWIDRRRPELLWTHPPNGGLRRVRQAAAFKRMGVKAGVPDILIFTPPPNTVVPGVAIELKREVGGTMSAAQRQWGIRLTELGWLHSVQHGATDAIKWLEELGYQ